MAEGDTAETPDPLAEMKARLDALATENAELRGKVEGLSARPAPAETAPKPAPEITRAQLDEQVAAGRMTQAQADQMVENQIIGKATSAAARTAETVVTTATGVARIDAAIGEYTALLPDLKDRKSANFERVAREFEAIVAAEQHVNPDYRGTKADEVKALRAAFGPADALRRARQSGERETHQEIGTGRAPPNERPERDGAPKGVPPEHVPYYRDCIARGLYKDWDAVRETLKFAGRGKRKAA